MKQMRKKEHKQRYNMVKNPDSIWSRNSGNRTEKGKQKGGKEIQTMLGIEDDGHHFTSEQPMSMMDIVIAMLEKEKRKKGKEK